MWLRERLAGDIGHFPSDQGVVFLGVRETTVGKLFCGVGIFDFVLRQLVIACLRTPRNSLYTDTMFSLQTPSSERVRIVL